MLDCPRVSVAEIIAAICGSGGVAGLAGHAVGWRRSEATARARVEKIADEAMQGLITNLRQDSEQARARADAADEKADRAMEGFEHCRAEHAECRRDLAEVHRLRTEDRALIDQLMAEKGRAPPYEPKPQTRRPRR